MNRVEIYIDGRLALDRQAVNRTRHLTSVEWQALADAERRIGEPGYISYTDVNVREEDTLAAMMWDHAWNQMDAAGEFDGKQPQVKYHMVARRIARALAIMVFGPEFLLK